MSHANDATQVALAEKPKSAGGLAPDIAPPLATVTIDRGPAITPSEGCNANVYRSLADAMFPRWRRVLAAAPGALERKRPSSQARGLFHVTASALASALSCEGRSEAYVDRSLISAVESALVGWQLSHGGDGRPRARILRRDSLTVASTYHVVVLLSECEQFRTSLLMGDLAAHLEWLRSCSGFPPWIEARVVASLADGGTLLGDDSLIAAAESRAKSLCVDGGIPGWCGATTCGDLSLVSAALDPLARTYSLYQWKFLGATIRAMGELLEFVADRAGAIGGLRNVLRLPFSLPFGITSIARSGFGCSGLALHGRAAIERVDASVLLSWGEDLVAMVGPSVALCLTKAPTGFLEEPTGQVLSDARRSEDDAGICVHRTESYDALVDLRRGGAVRIRWAGTGQTQEDHGLRAVFGGASLTSESIADRFDSCEDTSTVSLSGAFAVDDGFVSSGLSVAGKRATRSPRPARKWLGLCPSGDRYTREIRFESTRVIITDSFRLRAAADFVLVGANGLDDHPGALGENQLHVSRDDAIVLEDSIGATITRVFEQGRVVNHEIAE